MANPLPEPPHGAGADEAARALGEALDGLLEFTGAKAGWVALRRPDGGLTFPASRGPLPDRCLALQGGRDGVWGFAVREGPTLLNDLSGMPPLGEPPLRSLLSSPLGSPESPLGHVGLANKPSGFTSHDAAVLQGVAHLMARGVRRAHGGLPLPPELAVAALERVEDAVLVVDEAGRLVYFNPVWAEWTGFRPEELLGLPAPFPFWPSHRELSAVPTATAWPEGLLPFRRRDRSVLWCRVEKLPANRGGRPYNAAVLRRADLTRLGKESTSCSVRDSQTPAAIPSPPRADWLPLLLEPGREVASWDARWERLTGLAAADLSAVRCEVVLDWLFPRQSDRNLVADWMHDPNRRGGQAVLEVMTEGGGRPMLFTTLPLPDGPGGECRWLLLAAPEVGSSGTALPPRSVVRRLTAGLSRLLNYYFEAPVGLAEAALDDSDLPQRFAARFQEILDSCQRASRLVAELEDLAAESPGETQALALSGLVREFLAGRGSPGYTLRADLEVGEELVRVNPRMLRVVLGHLLSNAEQALAHAARREVTVRVFSTNGAVRCEVEDTGEGLPAVGLWVPEPFDSTRGAFARDPAHAAQEGAGLGLAVCQHLLALHGGRMELRGVPGGGATAAFELPRSDAPAGSPFPAPHFSQLGRDLAGNAVGETSPQDLPPG